MGNIFTFLNFMLFFLVDLNDLSHYDSYFYIFVLSQMKLINLSFYKSDILISCSSDQSEIFVSYNIIGLT